jgi:hypothetical protein
MTTRVFVRSTPEQANSGDVLSAVAENERNTICEPKRQIYRGGKRPFGFDIVDGRLVPKAREQQAIARMQQLHSARVSLRKIGDAIASEFQQRKPMPAMTIKRIIEGAARRAA